MGCLDEEAPDLEGPGLDVPEAAESAAETAPADGELVVASPAAAPPPWLEGRDILIRVGYLVSTVFSRNISVSTTQGGGTSCDC